MAATAESRNEDLVVFLHMVETTVTRNKCRDLLAVLDELNSARLANGRVGLLGLNSDTLKDDTLCVGSAAKGVCFESSCGVFPRVAFVMPLLLAAMGAQLASALDSSGLTVTHGVALLRNLDVVAGRGG